MNSYGISYLKLTALFCIAVDNNMHTDIFGSKRLAGAKFKLIEQGDPYSYSGEKLHLLS